MCRGDKFALQKRSSAGQNKTTQANACSSLTLEQASPAYVASTTDFNAAKPFSNWPPTIFSQLMIQPMALLMKLFFPYILHVTVV